MKPSTHKPIMISLAFLTALTLHLLLFSYSPLISSIMLEMKLSHTQAGLVFSTCILSITLLRIPWGLLSDKIGFIRAMKIATMFVGIFGFVRAFSPNYIILLASQLFLGVGFAAILPCLPKLVNTLFKEEVGLATGIYVTGFPIGEILGFSLTSWLLKNISGWRSVLEIFGVWSITLAALWWIFGGEEIRDKDENKATSLRSDLVKILKTREMWFLAGLCICSMGFYDTLALWLPYILELKGVPSELAGLTSSILPLGFILAGPVIGVVSDKLGVRKPFIIILGLISGINSILIIVVNQFYAWISIFLTGFCITGILTLILIIPTEISEFNGFVGSVVGLMSSLGNIGSLLIPIGVGFILDATGSLILVMVMLSVISSLNSLLGLIIRETGRQSRLTS